MLELALWGAVAPLALALISSLLVFPAVLEEVVKWAILKYAPAERVLSTTAGAVVGMVFGISESLLYSMNAWSGGQWGAIGVRLLLTVPMHTVTGVVIAWAMGRGVGVLGVIVAMVIHGAFNYMVR